MGQFRDVLRSMLINCHKHGDFILSCGSSSSDYYDLAPLFLNPTGLRVASVEVMAALGGTDFDALGCLELCPVPLVGAVLRATFVDKKGFIVRKGRKGYGTNNLVEGALESGDRCIIIEDVVSTGQSVLGAVQAVEECGGCVVGVLGVINRQEGCDEILGAYNFRYLFTKSELEGV